MMLNFLKYFIFINLNNFQIMLILLGAVANYGYGFFYFFDSEHNLTSDPSVYYLLFFIFVLPGSFFLFAGFLLWK